MTANQSKIRSLLTAQQQLNSIATLLSSEQVLTTKMQELVQSLQTELDFELMLEEEWS
jgi:hypothetical protein